MPSPIPTPIYAGVNTPGESTQFGCVPCLRDGVTAPLEIAYHVGGYTLCAKHTAESFQHN